ncbi:MAG: DUF4251 domain-containing protein [Cyclobacteriaceae bacterium]
MKKATSLLLGIFIIALYNPLKAQDEPNELKPSSYEELKKAVESGELIMRFYEASTQRGATVQLESSSNAVVLTPQASAGNLPYFGNTRVLSSDFDSGGLEFDGTTERRRVKFNDKKQRVQISYSVKGNADSFSISLTLSGGGSTSMSISSVNRDRISYRGNYEIK